MDPNNLEHWAFLILPGLCIVAATAFLVNAAISWRKSAIRNERTTLVLQTFSGVIFAVQAVPVAVIAVTHIGFGPVLISAIAGLAVGVLAAYVLRQYLRSVNEALRDL